MLLKEKERTIIMLRFLEEMDFDEMVAALGKNAGALRTQLSRAVHRFKDCYEKLYS